jgi:hypothetical protein
MLLLSYHYVVVRTEKETKGRTEGEEGERRGGEKRGREEG